MIETKADLQPPAIVRELPQHEQNPFGQLRIPEPAAQPNFRELAFADIKAERAAPLKSSVNLGGVEVSVDKDKETATLTKIPFVDPDGTVDGQVAKGYDHLKVKINGAAANNIVVALTESGVKEYELDGKTYKLSDPASARELSTKLTEVDSDVSKAAKSSSGTITIRGKVTDPADFKPVPIKASIPEASVSLTGAEVSVTEKQVRISGMTFVDEHGKPAFKEQGFDSREVRPFKSVAINLTHALQDAGVKTIELGDKKYDLTNPDDALRFIAAVTTKMSVVDKKAGDEKGTIAIPGKIIDPPDFKSGTVP